MRYTWKWLFILLCGANAYAECPRVNKDTANFVLVKEDNGIAIYERWYEVRPDLQAREIKATFRANAQPHAAVALLRNESKGRMWNKNTESYRILHQDDNIWFGYIQYDLPWPVSNQDCVLQYSQNLRGNSLHIEFKETDHPAFPIQKRIHRIPQINGRWIFTEGEQGISVEYYITTTPSATLPTWLTDPIIRNNLIETLQVFRKILEGNG
jgi:hypothetical protein